MREFAIPFTEVVIPLRRPDTVADIARYSLSGKVPVLIDRHLTVWDTLAIVEHLADHHPGLGIWPRDPEARSIARCVSAEMHAGFADLRRSCPMDFNARDLAPLDAGAITIDVRRILALWAECRAHYGGRGGGPFLFGAFSAADAMYAPVVSRFTSYRIDLTAHGDATTARAYMDAIRALPGWTRWAADAAAEG
jgi:glutathione S-transferase